MVAAAGNAWDQSAADPLPSGCQSRLITLLVWTCVLAVSGPMLFAELWGLASPEVRPGLLASLAFLHMLVSSFWLFAGTGSFAAAVLACVLRRWRAAAVLAALGVWGCGPWAVTLGRPAHDDAVQGNAASTAEIIVLSVNLLHDRADLAAVRRFADELGASVIAFQEVSPGVAAELTGRFGDAYPHIAITEELGTWGNATLSEWPFVGDDEPPWDELPKGDDGDVPEWFNYFPAVRVTIDTPGGPVDIVNVHPPPPVGRGAVHMQDAVMRGVLWDLRESGDADDEPETGQSTWPTIVLGDFNCTHRGVVCRLMSRAGFVEAHAAIGRGLGATWPEGRLPGVPPLVRIDHVWSRGAQSIQLEPVATGVGPAVGSDHRPVWARLRFGRE